MYDNYKIMHPDGEIMCYCSKNRAEWYLSKELANTVDHKTIQLTFTPKGYGRRGEDYYLESRENKCVVCGTNKELTKHHIVPYQYRKHMSVQLKSHQEYDVLCVCNTCHREYEIEATKLKNSLTEEYYSATTNFIKKLHKLRGYIKTVDGVNNIPLHRRNEMNEYIDEMISGWKITRSITHISELIEELECSSHIIDTWCASGKTIQDFIIMWRNHFINTSNPQHLSDVWVENINTVKGTYS